tara:strand:+ start:29578 stop:29769 length:192 start_codon:yes stop_codon:yes gene_type:complete
VKVGDLVRDCDGILGIVTDLEMYFELIEDDDQVITVHLVTVYTFAEREELIFFHNELEVLHHV